MSANGYNKQAAEAAWMEETKGVTKKAVEVVDVPKRIVEGNMYEYKVSGSTVPYVYAMLLHENKTGDLCQFDANHRHLRWDHFAAKNHKKNAIIKHFHEHTLLHQATYFVTPYQIPKTTSAKCWTIGDVDDDFRDDDDDSVEGVDVEPILSTPTCQAVLL